MAVDSGGRIKGVLASVLAGWCTVVDGLRLARVPDRSRATGHLAIVGKRTLIGIIPRLENCEAKLGTQECLMRCSQLGPDTHPLPPVQGLLSHSER